MTLIRNLLLSLALFLPAGAFAAEVRDDYSREAWTHYLAGDYVIVENLINEKIIDLSGSDLYLKYLISEAHITNKEVPISYSSGIRNLRKALDQDYALAFHELAFQTWLEVRYYGNAAPEKINKMLELLVSWKIHPDSRHIEYVARMLEREFRFNTDFNSDKILEVFPQFKGMSISQIYEQNFRKLNDAQSAFHLARSLTMDIWSEQYTDIEAASFDALVKHRDSGVDGIYSLFGMLYENGLQVKADSLKAYEYYLIADKIRHLNPEHVLSSLNSALSETEKSAAHRRADKKFEKLKSGANFYSRLINWCYSKFKDNVSDIRLCKSNAWADHLICNKPVPVREDDYYNSIAYSDCRLGISFWYHRNGDNIRKN